MNTTTDAITVAPEVREFLAAVRGQLADLDPDEQRDITEGLEADLTDLVAERGGEALGDPVAYARELRAAAGLDPEMTRGLAVPRRSASEVIGGLMDAARQGFDGVITKLPGDVSAVLTWLRPFWWIARGWAGVQVLDMYGGRTRMNLVPDLHGVGWLLCLVAVAGSIAIGLGRIWPGSRERGTFARTVLLALNLCAIVAAPLAVSQVLDDFNQRYDRGYLRGFDNGVRADASDPGTNRAGVYVDGRWISNIYPYDAKGHPLVGVQLYDQVGEPINVITQPEYPNETCVVKDGNGACLNPNNEVVRDADGNPLPKVFYPWTNGATQLFNVFPIPSRLQESEEPSATAFSEKHPPLIEPFPLASVPKVSLPGITPSRQTR